MDNYEQKNDDDVPNISDKITKKLAIREALLPVRLIMLKQSLNTDLNALKERGLKIDDWGEKRKIGYLGLYPEKEFRNKDHEEYKNIDLNGESLEIYLKRHTKGKRNISVKNIVEEYQKTYSAAAINHTESKLSKTSIVISTSETKTTNTYNNLSNILSQNTHVLLPGNRQSTETEPLINSGNSEEKNLLPPEDAADTCCTTCMVL